MEFEKCEELGGYRVKRKGKANTQGEKPRL